MYRRGPGHAYLVTLGQMVVDGVDHDTHHTALGLADGVRPPLGAYPCGADLAQISLVEKDRRRSHARRLRVAPRARRTRPSPSRRSRT